MRRLIHVLIVGVACALLITGRRSILVEPPLAAQSVTAPAGEYVGTETCVSCHAPQGEALSRTEHGRTANPRTPLAGLGCETCHGPGRAHVAGGGDVSKIRVPTKMAPREVSELCMTCHNRGNQALW